MTSLAVYFDDSYNDDGVFAVAGYMATVDFWDRFFSDDWLSVIRSAPHLISEFKASDCRQQANEFSAKEGWTRPECDDLTIKLVNVITDQKYHDCIIGVGSAVVFPRFTNRRLRDLAFLWCAGSVIHAALAWSARNLSEPDDVHIILDNHPDLRGKLATIFDTVMGSMDPLIRARVSPLSFGDSHRLAPLQAADLLAYETYKELHNRLETPPRPVSKALDALVKSQLHHGDFMTLEALLESHGNTQRLGDEFALPRLYRSATTTEEPTFRDANNDLDAWLRRLRRDA